LVGWQERHLACKKWGDGGDGHWLVQIECPPPSSPHYCSSTKERKQTEQAKWKTD